MIFWEGTKKFDEIGQTCSDWAHIENPDSGHRVLDSPGGFGQFFKKIGEKIKIEFLYVSRRARENAMQYDAIDKKVMDKHHLIVNASPIGTFPNNETMPNLPYSLLTRDHVLYDLIYNPPETRFLSEGKQRGCKIINGLKMLEYQAEKSWEIWNQ